MPMYWKKRLATLQEVLVADLYYTFDSAARVKNISGNNCYSEREIIQTARESHCLNACLLSLYQLLERHVCNGARRTIVDYSRLQPDNVNTLNTVLTPDLCRPGTENFLPIPTIVPSTSQHTEVSFYLHSDS